MRWFAWWVCVVVARAEPPKIVELRVPEPTQMPPLPPPPGAPPEATSTEGLPPGGEGGAPAPTPSSPGRSGPRATKLFLREVKGISPATLWGRYQIVQVTEGGETADYATTMARTSMALQSDCVTVGTVFDFGKESPGLPQQVQIAEYRQCTKGGIGSYANELAIALPATFDAAPTGLTLELPAVEAVGTIVRVRTPSANDLSTPSHWMGPAVEVSRPVTKYTVVAEFDPKPPKPPRTSGSAPGAPPPGPGPALAVHLSFSATPGGAQTVLHLEPVLDPNAWMNGGTVVAEKSASP